MAWRKLGGLGRVGVRAPARTLAALLGLSLQVGQASLAGRAVAQSLSIEEKPQPPEAPTPAPAPKPSVPAPAPVIVMPTASSTPLEYPADGRGEASVALELTLTAAGDVTKAVALEGDEPFASRAVEAAKTWKFQPATRDGKPIAAKIRYLVRFVPPRDEVEPEPEAPATPATPGSQAASKPRAEPEPYEIVVVGERAPIRHQLARTEISRMPGAFGDAFRAIEALPGVVPIVSGLPYFYVRGAPPGNVGYYFDGIPVPFLYHFAAGPSVFHPAFIDRVDLYPGAFPVRYGRFAGAIVAGEMAPPGYRFRGEWNVRLVDSGAMVEAPFAGGRGSAMVGGRFSYTGLMISLIAPEVSVGYWDYQARVRYDLSPKDSVEVFGFGSGDYTTVTEKVTVFDAQGRTSTKDVTHDAVDIGFHRLDLRWDHRLDQGNWRNALMVGRDRTGLADGEINVYNYMVGYRSEYWRQLETKVRLRAGADVLFESLKQEFKDGTPDSGEVTSAPDPGVMQPNGGEMMPGSMMPTPIPPEGQPPGSSSSNQEDAERLGFNSARKDFSLGLYADLVWDVAPRLQITPGLRGDLFVSGSRAALSLDPRITAEYTLSKKLKLVHGLALVHQAPSFVGPVPGFKPSLEGGLQKAVQYSAGVNYELPWGFQSSVALFQSAFFNMTDLISLIQLEQTANRGVNGGDGVSSDSDINNFRTDGQAYGLELMVRRSLSRRLGGFLSYTLSRSQRFSGRVSGPATTDRNHVLNVAASYDLGRNWRLGGRVLFYTGVPAEVAYLEAARHPPRTPPFWRLDFKLEKRWYIKRPDRWWGLNIEVLNTTLNKEQLTGSCNAFDCVYEEIGPVTVPSIAFEGAY
ncbi:MAG TPA: TonB-dependent receptor [Polyangiaceae bacterium]|nr:TonB-dependent receptor [Polyangiaceae bacterium]